MRRLLLLLLLALPPRRRGSVERDADPMSSRRALVTSLLLFAAAALVAWGAGAATPGCRSLAHPSCQPHVQPCPVGSYPCYVVTAMPTPRATPRPVGTPRPAPIQPPVTADMIVDCAKPQFMSDETVQCNGRTLRVRFCPTCALVTPIYHFPK